MLYSVPGLAHILTLLSSEASVNRFALPGSKVNSLIANTHSLVPTHSHYSLLPCLVKLNTILYRHLAVSTFHSLEFLHKLNSYPLFRL